MTVPEQSEPEKSPFTLSDKNYGILKWVTGIILPSIGTLYFALSVIWGLPAAQQILGTIIAVQAFLGAALGISTHTYNSSDARFSGDINVIERDDKTIYSLELNHSPEELEAKKEAIFKVNTPK
jgi:hypothetical protein